MSKWMKIWLTIASSCIIVGGLIFGIIMTALDWDFRMLSTVTFVKNDYTISEAFRDISIVTDTADVEFILDSVQKTTVICYEDSRAEHSVKVERECLEIKVKENVGVNDFININFNTPKITVILPNSCGKVFVKTSTGDVDLPDDFTFESIDVSVATGDVACLADSLHGITVKSTTGDIYLSECHAGKMSLSTTTGDISVEKTYCDSDISISVTTGDTYLNELYAVGLYSKGTSGKIDLNKVTPSDKISIERSTGDVLFKESDATEIYVLTNTGDVYGTLLSEKTFVTSTNTGRIDVSKTAKGGKCEIKTNTGDIEIFVQKQN